MGPGPCSSRSPRRLIESSKRWMTQSGTALGRRLLGLDGPGRPGGLRRRGGAVAGRGGRRLLRALGRTRRDGWRGAGPHLSPAAVSRPERPSRMTRIRHDRAPPPWMTSRRARSSAAASRASSSVRCSEMTDRWATARPETPSTTTSARRRNFSAPRSTSAPWTLPPQPGSAQQFPGSRSRGRRRASGRPPPGSSTPASSSRRRARAR